MQARSSEIGALFAGALQHQRAGRLDEADRLYSRILELDPCHADSLHLLGVIAHKSGRNESALDMIRRAIAINPAIPSYHSNLGNLLLNQVLAEEAAACHRRAVELKPDYAETLNQRGKELRKLQRPAEALANCLPGHDGALAQRPAGDCHSRPASMRSLLPISKDRPVALRAGMGSALPRLPPDGASGAHREHDAGPAAGLQHFGGKVAGA
nr:tetratricopeptide repeat protein [uncultured Rhodopila sp.]